MKKLIVVLVIALLPMLAFADVDFQLGGHRHVQGPAGGHHQRNRRHRAG